MISLLYSIAAFVIALGILIIVHEFGHYWVAKKLGVKVLKFSVGFGKAIFTRKFGKDQTQFVIGMIPLGGYVKMLDESEGKVAKNEKDRAFNRQPIPKRMAIVLAGPAFNFLFAVLATWLVFVIGIQDIKPVIGEIKPYSIAAKSGLKVGDEFLEIDGKPAVSWSHRRLYIFYQALNSEVLQVKVKDKSGRIRNVELDLSAIPPHRIDAKLFSRELGIRPNLPKLPSVIGIVAENGPAKKAGMQADDRVISVNGRSVQTWNEMAGLIRAKPNRTIRVGVLREGARRTLKIKTTSIEHEGKIYGIIKVGPKAIPIPESYRTKVQYSAIQAIGEASNHTWLMSVLTLKMLYKMILLEVSAKNISGPITIADYAGQSARIGFVQFLMFLSVVSVSLGVLNLLPIPVLDGGHFMYYVVEVIKGKPVSERVLQIGQTIGLALLGMLMILAFYNDITRLIK